MASPPPHSNTSAASMSRSKTSRDEIRSLADEMLRASVTRSVSSPLASVSSSSSASVSRSKTSRDDIRSLADEMLRTSLSRSVSSPSSVSTLPPSYRTKNSPAPGLLSLPGSPRTPVDSLMKLRREKSRTATRPPTVGSTSSSSISSSSSRVSSAEAKLRVRELQREVDRVHAESKQRPTTGMFKAACSTDLLFLIDTTGSMGSYIDAAKEQVKSIVNELKEAFLKESNVRVAVVGYKDHMDTPNIQFLDFTTSVEQVHQFLDTLIAIGGGDFPEDVLGGVRQALNASWEQQTRCLIHITDAPPHGRALHDLSETQDYYYNTGSEPHGLTYEPLLRRLIQININYALLRINSSTDRMASAFRSVYTGSSGYSKAWSRVSSKQSTGSEPQFEELELGTTYSKLQHLVVKTVTGSVSRTASRLSMALSSGSSKAGTTGGKMKKSSLHMTAIREDEDSGGSGRSGGGGVGEVCLETVSPKWDTPGWLNETLTVEGFCPDAVLHNASTLNDMMEADENIKLSVTELTIYARSKPFAKGGLRVASYARTAASTSRFVVKSFMEDGHGLAHLAEDMRIQALCKAFALEFNGLLKTEHPIDFIVTTCLQKKSGTSGNSCLSLEPFIEGNYEKYNSNGFWVKEDSPDDPFNRTAQAFSHFTFERSWGHFLVNDLQGVGHLLTDPAIQTRNKERFKLNDTNLGEEGFKFFFALHECNSICRKLGLKSNREMVMSGIYEFRERWPTMDPTVCCSNKLCRRIIRLASAHESDTFPGYHWCNTCWPQLQSSIVRWICVGPGPNHEFDISKFFHESQGQATPRKCPEHLEKDPTVSSAAAVGGNLWNKMKSEDTKSYISGRSW